MGNVSPMQNTPFYHELSRCKSDVCSNPGNQMKWILTGLVTQLWICNMKGLTALLQPCHLYGVLFHDRLSHKLVDSSVQGGERHSESRVSCART